MDTLTEPDWTSLPIEVVDVIVGKLWLSDRVRFTCACKAWRLPIGPYPAREENPWMLSLVTDRSGSRVIKLLNPYRNKKYVVKEICGKATEVVKGTFWASRYGWLTCNKGESLPGKRYLFSTYLFNPFSEDIIEFPEMNMELEEEWCVPVASLFVDNTSPKCSVYAIWRKTNWICMATVSPGDTVWETSEFRLEGFENFLPHGVTFLSGSFYTITTALDVGVFHLASKKWRFIEAVGEKPIFHSQMDYYGSAVATDKDLLFYQCHDVNGIGDYACGSGWSLWRFDFLKKCWISEDSGNHSIFSSKSTSFSVRPVGIGRELAGMVFAVDQYVSRGGRNIESNDSWLYAQFYAWMAREGKNKKLWNMWIDPRSLWSKSDLVKNGEVPSLAVQYV